MRFRVSLHFHFLVLFIFSSDISRSSPSTRHPAKFMPAVTHSRLLSHLRAAGWPSQGILANLLAFPALKHDGLGESSRFRENLRGGTVRRALCFDEKCTNNASLYSFSAMSLLSSDRKGDCKTKAKKGKERGLGGCFCSLDR